MEYEQINDDTIRVSIKNSDLKAHGLSLVDFLRNRHNVELFFHQILDEIDLGDEFQKSEAVTFQIIPNMNGVELYISKGDDFQEDLLNNLVDDFHRRYISEDTDELLENIEETDEWQELTDSVVAFDSFEDVVALAHRLTMEAGMSSLYEYDNQYYMVFNFFTEHMHDRMSEEEVAIALEYGGQTDLTPEIIQEHGHLLIPDTALEEIRYYF